MSLSLAVLAFAAGIFLGVIAAPRAASHSRRDPSGPFDSAVRNALTAVASGDAAAAAAALRRAVQLDSTNDALYLLMGQQLLESGDVSRAERVADVLLSRRDLSDSFLATAWLLKGQASEAASSVEAAIAAYRAAVEASPGATAAWIALGRALANERRWAEAIEAGEGLAKLSPESGSQLAARRRSLLARERLAEGRGAEAGQLATEALREAPELAAAHLVRGDASFQSGQIGEAIEAWSNASRFSDVAAALVVERLEQIGELTGDSDRARNFARDALGSRSGSGAGAWRIYAWLADDALRRARVEEAREWCGELEKTGAGVASAHRLRVRCDLAAQDAPPPAPLGATARRWGEESCWVDPWRCGRCGAESSEFEWRCATCHTWGNLS